VGIYMLSTTHEDEIVGAPLSTEKHEKKKNSCKMDYNKNKISIDNDAVLLSFGAT
jgi:hypothetical protein